MTVDRVMREVERDTVFHDGSGGGVTMSGGEPLHQPAFLQTLLRQCRTRRIHTAVETCGDAPPRTLLAVAEWTDLFLYDLKLMDDARHRAATGRSNRRILENLRLLTARHPSVRVRMPLIGRVNDDRANIRAVGAFLSELPVSEIDILPYHTAGVAKYARLDRPYPPGESAIPSAETIDMAKETLSRCGLDVQVGGAR
jgi:pyruvate formate lyase activating enzyme